MRWLLPPLALLLTGCLGATPERARIDAARLIHSGNGTVLEIEQTLKLSRTMLRALSSGIDLRLDYRVHGCGPEPVLLAQHSIVLRYAPLRRAYEVDMGAQGLRHFPRRSAMLGALDRVRLPLPARPAPNCQGRVKMALDLTSLPTPLRIPAFFKPAEWRLVSPARKWQAGPV